MSRDLSGEQIFTKLFCQKQMIPDLSDNDFSKDRSNKNS